jgi:hypothetical protein
VLAIGTTSALAETLSPWWHLTSSVRPTVLQQGGQGLIGFRASNLGDAPTSGEITFTVTLPAGVTAQKIPKGAGEPEEVKATFNTFPEGEAPVGESCSEPAAGQLRCSFEGVIEPYTYVELSVAVNVAPEAASGGVAVAEVTGAGLPPAHVEQALTVGAPGQATPFGVEHFSIVPEEEGGGVQAQAGSHPFQLTTTFALNQSEDTVKPPALAKQLTFSLSPGLVANAVAFPRCSELEFLTRSLATNNFGDDCPANTAVGVAILQSKETFFVGEAPSATYPVPVFNLTPSPGEPVRFGFFLIGIAVTIDFHIRAGEDYGATATVSSVTQLANFIAESLTIWGAPGDPAHEHSRGWGCLAAFYRTESTPCNPTSESHPPPFLTLPTSCASPFAASVTGESWPKKSGPEAEAHSIELPEQSYSLKDEFGRPIGLSGCDQLPFSPFIEVAPDVQDASTSTGLKVDVRVPQEVSENAGGLAGSSVRDITVALPEGVAVNPSGGNGLEACSEGQVGFEAGRGENGFEEFNHTTEPGSKTPLFSPTVPEPLSPGLNLGAEGFCPNASKIGTVKIKSPLIANPLEGSVYLATQNANPFGSLIAAYIVAEDPVSGVLVKLPGKVSLCQSAGEVIAGETCGAPGQLVSTFENEPQLPFEDAELHFFGGERAPLATPAHCGTYTTHAAFVPWSAEKWDEAQVTKTATSTFAITSGPNGSACPGSALPFSPSLTGGTTNVNAGAFSPLTTTIGREDGQQNLQSVTLHLPAGLSGLLSTVKLCPEEQANAGTCGPESLIGETTVSAGVGSDPVAVKGGKVYITEKYEGAPYGLSVVNPVKAGPFDLEHDTSNPAQHPACDCLVVRAKLEVNPTTAALTAATDPSGPYAIPHLIDGVPVQIKKVNVTINRPGFTFNPTNCNPAQITGSISSDEGASAAMAVPFQVANCATLKFAPKIHFATVAKTSKADGASLTTTLTYPPNALGTYANVAKVKVDLPKQLPSRLTTLQKACLAATFEANPAACPPASIVGQAKVTTPLLPVALEGPAYFVSHGNEAFPSLTMVLQGYGVTIDLVGSTFIHGGITSTTFKATPDQPFETFQLTLPEGPYSALAANANLCTAKLAVPTAFVAQNGLEIHQDTPIAVTGCAKRPTRAQKLAQALARCRKKHNGTQRSACVRQARKRYT